MLSGMTMRQYFAAHAPSEPQPWFEPVMLDDIGPCPNAYKELSEVDWKNWTRELPEYDPEKCSQALLDFAERYADWQQKSRQLEIEREKQRYIQWPVAWADALLAELEK